MAAFTLTVTTRALFGVTLGDEVREIGEMVNRAVALLEKPSDPRVKQSMDELDAVVYRIIEQRRRDFQDGGDLLSSMILARDSDTGEAMSDEQLRNQVMTLMLAGYETTASALTWTWYLLSQHPDTFKRMQTEARQVLGGRAPLYADLDHLSYTRQVLNEGMRLYPPAWTLGRRALGEDEIGGYYIAPATTIAICLYTLHRHPRLLGIARHLRSRSILARALCRPSQIRVHSVRCRTSTVYWQHLWPHGSEPGLGPCGATLHPSTGSGGGCSTTGRVRAPFPARADDDPAQLAATDRPGPQAAQSIGLHSSQSRISRTEAPGSCSRTVNISGWFCKAAASKPRPDPPT